MLALALACDPPAPPGDLERYVEALALVHEDPEAALGACAELAGDQRKDCTWAAVKQLDDPALIEGACAALPEPDECWFLAAETTREPAFCHRAGGFVGECLMHLWSWALPAWLPAGTTPAEAVAIARPKLQAWEMAPTAHTWYETFAHVLTAPGLTPGGCEEVAGKPRRECEAALAAITGDPALAPPPVHRARRAWARQAR